MILKWTPNLSVQVLDVDRQHIELFKRTNSFIAAVMSGHGQDEVEKMLDFLEAYVVDHFAFEEKLMQESGYPEFPAHKEEHARFIADFEEFKKAFDYKSDSQLLVDQINERISAWWMKHIAVTDRAMGLYVKENRPKKTPA